MVRDRQAAKAAIRKTASGAAAKGAVKTAAKTATKKAVRKAAVKAGTKAAAKGLLRSIPGVGTLVGIGETVGSVVSAVKGAQAELPAMPSFGGFGMARKRRGKGITATELRGFKRVVSLLRSVGMKPKHIEHAPKRRK